MPRPLPGCLQGQEGGVQEKKPAQDTNDLTILTRFVASKGDRILHHLKLFLWCKHLEVFDKTLLSKGVLHAHCLGAEEREAEKEEVRHVWSKMEV